VEKVRPAYQAWLESLAEGLPERDVQSLARTVERLIDRLERIG
jgi:hypothetical protein